ncbi:hypothetical protein LINPERPRIM_LOCUS31840, partial [Linum perenne]
YSQQIQYWFYISIISVFSCDSQSFSLIPVCVFVNGDGR